MRKQLEEQIASKERGEEGGEEGKEEAGRRVKESVEEGEGGKRGGEGEEQRRGEEGKQQGHDSSSEGKFMLQTYWCKYSEYCTQLASMLAFGFVSYSRYCGGMWQVFVPSLSYRMLIHTYIEV